MYTNSKVAHLMDGTLFTTPCSVHTPSLLALGVAQVTTLARYSPALISSEASSNTVLYVQ